MISKRNTLTRKMVRRLVGLVQLFGFSAFLLFILVVEHTERREVSVGLVVLYVMWMVTTCAVKCRMVIDACGRRVHLFAIGFFVIFWLAIHGPRFPLTLNMTAISLIDFLAIGFIVVMVIGDLLDLFLVPKKSVSATCNDPILMV